MTSPQTSPSEPSADSSLPDVPSSVPVPQDTLPDDRFPVVGIGASAGGLEAFTQLLNHLPSDTGMAFVLIQHLDPSHPSLLCEILARATPMPVYEAQDGMAIAPNQIYVIPPNTLMTLAQGQLHLTARERTQKISKAVDTFFISLANERGCKAIAVVLSGSANDGTQGLESIKAAGGITFAQSSESAQVNSMPNTAIASGQVDFILTPEAIATELANISRHPYITTPSQRNIEDDIRELQDIEQIDLLSTIFTLIQSSFGVDFTHYKRTTIQRRISRRMALHHLEKLSDYICYLQQNPSEVQALYQEILIHVTSFFRDRDVFDILKREVYPTFLRDRPIDSPIRIWVAGCSTGEEAYSIAISLLEFLEQQLHQPQIQVFATDVSDLAIERARTGIYTSSQLVDVSSDRLHRFFVPIEGGYQISKTVRERCVFARQNLLSDPPFSRMDLISCRNVLIYFGALLQKKILPMFHYGLKPAGFLMLGSSETVGELPHLFHLADRKHKIYAKQPALLQLPMELERDYHPSESPPSRTNVVQSSQTQLSELVDQIVLSQYAPVGVVVNAQLDIVQFRGQMGAYLEPSPGQASLNVLSMVKDELRLELRTAIHHVRQEKKAIRKEGIQLKQANQSCLIQIDVAPIQLDANPTSNPTSDLNSDAYFLILFREMAIASVSSEADTTTRRSSERKKQNKDRVELLRLEQELETTKAHLRSIIEEQQATNQDLRAANEEILSSNEELQSTNEELQTAKEEIQATNEELSTINDELFRRNTETIQVSNDFQNLLSSINIPIVMLDVDLNIRRFTPTAASLFNLISTDIGRPLSDIKHNLTIDNLEIQILEVLSSLTLRSQEVQDHQGHWYDLRIRPYRTLDNRIDGAVVVVVDVNTLKRSTDELQLARDYAEAIVQTVRDSLLILNSDFQVLRANQRFYDTFQVSPAETERACVFELGNGQWNIPQLRSLLEDLLPHNTQIHDFHVVHSFDHIGLKTMQLNARKLPISNGAQLIVLAIEDISDR